MLLWVFSLFNTISKNFVERLLSSKEILIKSLNFKFDSTDLGAGGCHSTIRRLQSS